jgi:hypothetical protein
LQNYQNARSVCQFSKVMPQAWLPTALTAILETAILETATLETATLETATLETDFPKLPLTKDQTHH